MKRLFVAAALALLACAPELGERESFVSETRILAVRGEPPEARPGQSVVFSMLLATPNGPDTRTNAELAWCTTPKLLTENGTASAACLGSGVRPIANGSPIPTDSCFLFGPEVSSAELRPRDPDITGGFYQPVRVIAPGAAVAAFGQERLRCRLGNASADVAADFERRYVANENPVLLPLELPSEVVRGSAITLRAEWTAQSAEAYLALDIVEQRVVDRREAMRVSWFTTAGSFASDRTGRAEEERETFTENVWTAPESAGTAHLFVVLRDSRGGVAYATYNVATR